MIKTIKLFLYNLIFFLVAIIIIELIFGYWFDKNNFGPYMREHRMKKVETTSGFIYKGIDKIDF